MRLETTGAPIASDTGTAVNDEPIALPRSRGDNQRLIAPVMPGNIGPSASPSAARATSASVKP